MKNLPQPEADALGCSAALQRQIIAEIDQAGAWLSFARFMELALYTPGLGYYSGGAHKFGSAGDFVTAPELGSVFAQTLALQVAQIQALSARQVIELGAGSGRLAADLLLELDRLGCLPELYCILDLSGELRARQKQTITQRAPHLLERVRWLDRLPEQIDGLVLANELLDAMPVHLVNWRASLQGEVLIDERGVAYENDQLVWRDRPASGAVLARAQHLAVEQNIVPLEGGYLSELSLVVPAWLAALSKALRCGALLLIDYGFPQREYYHPQRHNGTLMCHYRHYAHGEAFYFPGLQDITAHVDFTAVTESACANGLDLLGYTTQSTFLFNCGVTEVLARTPADDALRYLPIANEVQKLISPAEMGELFKVIAFGKGLGEPLIGFKQGDRSHTL
ncbi:MAG: SAM-dependent methyltransferase [Pseudomonadota bacterium]